jgi:hypothetical protein
MPYDVALYPDGSEPDDIAFHAIHGKDATPQEGAFALAIETDCSRLRWVDSKISKNHIKSNEFKVCLREFYRAAQAVQDGAKAPPDFGKLLEGSRGYAMNTIGRRFLVKFIKPVIVICVTVILISLGLLLSRSAIANFIQNSMNEIKHVDVYLSALCYAWIGSSIAIMLSYLWRMGTVKWDSIEYIDPAGLPPAMRALGILLLVILLMVLLLSRIIIIGLANTPLNDFVPAPGTGELVPSPSFLLSFLVGAVCGLSEAPLIRTLQTLFGNLTTRPGAVDGHGTVP